MRLLLDQDVYALTARFLKNLGHEVITTSEIGCSRASDAALLEAARERGCLFVTRDRHFGSLVFLQNLGAGVIYLRMLPSHLSEVHAELAVVLKSYSEDALRTAFIVVEAGRHRFRRLSG